MFRLHVNCLHGNCSVYPIQHLPSPNTPKISRSFTFSFAISKQTTVQNNTQATSQSRSPVNERAFSEAKPANQGACGDPPAGVFKPLFAIRFRLLRAALMFQQPSERRSRCSSLQAQLCFEDEERGGGWGGGGGNKSRAKKETSESCSSCACQTFKVIPESPCNKIQQLLTKSIRIKPPGLPPLLLCSWDELRARLGLGGSNEGTALSPHPIPSIPRHCGDDPRMEDRMGRRAGGGIRAAGLMRAP